MKEYSLNSVHPLDDMNFKKCDNNENTIVLLS